MSNQKGIAHLLVLILVLGGIALGVVLTFRPQIFSPLACTPTERTYGECRGADEYEVTEITECDGTVHWSTPRLNESNSIRCQDKGSVNTSPGSDTSCDSSSQQDITGACNPACCSFDSQCGDGGACNIGNGYCKSGFSCGDAQSAPTRNTSTGTNTTSRGAAPAQARPTPASTEDISSSPKTPAPSPPSCTSTVNCTCSGGGSGTRSCAGTIRPTGVCEISECGACSCQGAAPAPAACAGLSCGGRCYTPPDSRCFDPNTGLEIDRKCTNGSLYCPSPS